jgi:sucrose phosphorylase
MKNQVQLITYADRLGSGGIVDLHQLLKGSFSGLFGGVHILPFYYPFNGTDAGFDPIDHLVVDPHLGSWDDITRLSNDVNIMADLIVNHISVESPQFMDYSERGDDSPYRDLFLTLGKVFPNGATEDALLQIYLCWPN